MPPRQERSASGSESVVVHDQRWPEITLPREQRTVR
jgi:hypothetical protein